MSSSSEPRSNLAGLARPIRYALGRDGQNLKVVKDLEATLLRGLAPLRDAPSRPNPTLEKLAQLALGLDQLALEEKRARLQKMLALIEGPEPEAPKKATPPRAKKIEQAAIKIEAAPAKAKRVPIEKAQPADRLADLIGVGPKTAEHFAARGLTTVADALFFLPRRYDDRSRLLTIAELTPGVSASVSGEVRASTVRPIGRGKRVFEMAVSDGTGTVSVRLFRFHQTQLEGRYPRGSRVSLSGPVTAYGAMKQMIHPEIERLEEGEVAAPAGIVPAYAEIEGVPAKSVRRILADLADAAASAMPDPLPESLRARLGLPPLGQVLRKAHRPETLEGEQPFEAVRRRLVFDEVYFLQLALLSRLASVEAEPGLRHEVPASWPSTRDGLLPFRLTGAQARALAQIEADLAAAAPMNRLLLGDVGSGKTAVAFLAAMRVKAAGHQTALLAPTEILAQQHEQNARRLLVPAGARIGLLTGSTKTAEKKRLLEALAAGQIDLLIGTHALLEPPVVFRSLGLSIVDEQHRFGVEQRVALRNKGGATRPDVLVMTATPIPRTLALTAYGDLRVSLIDELPPGRAQVTTRCLPARRVEEVYALIDRELAAGRQAFVVFPLVEASEKLDLGAATEAVDALQARFSQTRVGLLHGRLSSEEKSAVMAAFVKGEIGVLVSTTVVEVGVDVAAASVMLVEDAERFGLSQLHQLRGRIGRSQFPGSFFLLTRNASNEAWARIQLLEKHTDGFAIAEEDLRIRGPGELLGTKQSGLPDLILTDLVRDVALIEMGRKEAQATLAKDPELRKPENADVARELTRRFRDMIDLVRIG